MIAKIAFFLVLGEIYSRLLKDLKKNGMPTGWASLVAFLLLPLPIGFAWLSVKCFTWAWT